MDGMEVFIETQKMGKNPRTVAVLGFCEISGQNRFFVESLAAQRFGKNG